MTERRKNYRNVSFFLAGITICIIIVCGFLPACNADEAESSNPVDVNEIVKGNTQFACELYGRLAGSSDENENLFLSPYSISTALALTYAGAEGETEKQMADTLHFGLEEQKLHQAFGALEKQLNEKGAEGVFELTVANALWGQKGFNFLESFTDLVNRNYSAGLNEVDFQNNTEQARQTINKWVEEKTSEKIKELIKPGVLDGLTRLVLTNAIYFKGKWQYEFDEKETRDADFHTSSTQTVTVPMMSIKKEFNYAEKDGLKILELGYKGDALSMFLFLPEEIDGIQKLEKQLTVENLNDWLDELNEKEVRVFLPRFKFTSEFRLNDVLAQMGMPVAFSGNADFSGMTGGRDLYISDVVHKAFVEVNEEGTEAAAATGVVMRLTSVRQMPVFRADHPFVFMIRDNDTGSILFIGRVNNPIQGE